MVTVPKLYDDGQVISSTRVRALMDQGNMRKVNELLERPFFVQGTVCHGEALGRTIGFPTANLLAPKGKKLPPFGVYATKVHCGKRYMQVLQMWEINRLLVHFCYRNRNLHSGF